MRKHRTREQIRDERIAANRKRVANVRDLEREALIARLAVLAPDRESDKHEQTTD